MHFPFDSYLQQQSSCEMLDFCIVVVQKKVSLFVPGHALGDILSSQQMGGAYFIIIDHVLGDILTSQQMEDAYFIGYSKVLFPFRLKGEKQVKPLDQAEPLSIRYKGKGCKREILFPPRCFFNIWFLWGTIQGIPLGYFSCFLLFLVFYITLFGLYSGALSKGLPLKARKHLLPWMPNCHWNIMGTASGSFSVSLLLSQLPPKKFELVLKINKQDLLVENLYSKLYWGNSAHLI